MIIFSTKSANHITDKINLPKPDYRIEQFSDGELFIKINENVKGKDVWVIASTEPPAENLLELFFLLDTLTYLGTKKINLLFLYFGYARQAIAQHDESHSAQFICNILKNFKLNKTIIVHAHAFDVLQKFMKVTNVIDFDFFCQVAKNYDAVAAPDKGAVEFAQKVANECHKEIIFLHKIRPEKDVAKIESIEGNVAGKKILLIDDMISTGRTLIEACNELKRLGALDVSAAATHGVFASGSYERLEDSTLKNIYVTNTLNRKSQGKIKIVDISKFIENVISHNPEG